MATERNYFIKMRHQAGVYFENFTEVIFRDILLTGTGHRDSLNRDSPGQTETNGRSNNSWNVLATFDLFRKKLLRHFKPTLLKDK